MSKDIFDDEVDNDIEDDVISTNEEVLLLDQFGEESQISLHA